MEERVAIKLKCLCGAKYTLDTSIAGKKARCKKCQRVLRIPSLMESDAMGQLRKVPVYEGPHRLQLMKKLQQTLSAAGDHRFILSDPLFPNDTLSVMRAQDLAAELANKGQFVRNEEGKREMVFYVKTDPQVIRMTLDKETDVDFECGIIAPKDDPENCRHYYKVDPNIYIGIAVGNVQSDDGAESSEDLIQI